MLKVAPFSILFSSSLTCFKPHNFLYPLFERQVIKELPDGGRHVLNKEGVIELERPGAMSIPSEIDHICKDRKSYEKDYKWRLQWCEERVTKSQVFVGNEWVEFEKGGLDYLKRDEYNYPYGLQCGGLIGPVRSILGIVNLSYMIIDDPNLLDEIIQDISDLLYQMVKYIFALNINFDYAHFWEDICFKNGPLVSPRFFAEKVGPHYKRITDLLNEHGIDIISVDSDGYLDQLIPIWLENGVNTMFPIEVGTWNASIAPWRNKYGKQIRGVGGVRKIVMEQDRSSIDAEIERIKPLIDLGGYIPCPDHFFTSGAEWDLVKYYCEKMRETFG